MNKRVGATFGMVLSALLSMSVMAQEGKPDGRVLITNANIFDGKGEKLAPGGGGAATLPAAEPGR